MGGRVSVNSMLILLQKREENPLKMSTRGRWVVKKGQNLVNVVFGRPLISKLVDDKAGSIL